MVTNEEAVIQPVFKVRNGRAQASVFERKRKGSSGEFISKSVALQVGYNKDGKWFNQNMTIVRNDLGNVIKALTAAEKAVAE